MLAEIEGQWSLDDAGNVTYQRIVELGGLSKNEIYSRGLNYFLYDTENAPQELTEDKELGRIVAKGFFDNVHSSSVFLDYTNFHCLNLIRIDAKEGRARILLTLTGYETEVGDASNNPPFIGTTKLSQEFPINPSGRSKTMMGKAFYNSHLKALETLERLAKAINDGNTSTILENDDW
ncbi:DUF4468 domain-containing protein [uncultured Croceitalea sp.]|uniref:DUF4468 domain-containing protein n=1 Tax=uncultured Croceitalea sp. TaxID=1798908 RepID=UPI0033059F9C